MYYDAACYPDEDDEDAPTQQEDTIARILFFVENNWNELLKFSRRTVSQMQGSTVQFDKSELRENFWQNKAQKRGNPLWISSFCNAVMAEIYRKAPQF